MLRLRAVVKCYPWRISLTIVEAVFLADWFDCLLFPTSTMEASYLYAILNDASQKLQLKTSPSISGEPLGPHGTSVSLQLRRAHLAYMFGDLLFPALVIEAKHTAAKSTCIVRKAEYGLLR